MADIQKLNVNGNTYDIFAHGVYGYEYSVIVTGDQNTYYPVVISTTSSKRMPNIITISKDLGTQTASYTDNHSNGSSSCLYRYEVRNQMWDGNGGYCKCLQAWYGYARLVAAATMLDKSNGNFCIWLRGGGTIYYIYTTFSSNATAYYSKTNLGSTTYPVYVEPMTSIGNGGWYSSAPLGCGDINGTATYASYLGTSSSYYTKSSLDTALAGKAAASHTHNYLPLSGGTITGTLNIYRDAAAIHYNSSSGVSQGWLGFSAADTPAVWMANGSTRYDLIHSGNYNSYTPTLTGTGASGTWGISISGNAATATSATTAAKLSSDAGSSTNPIYFSGGKPVACAYSLNKTVPSNAVFTDTNTWRPVTNTYTGSDQSTCVSQYGTNALYNALLNGYASSAGTATYASYLGTSSSYYTKSSLDTALNGKANSSHTHTKSQITDFPSSMPASDVYSWAKASTKPSYTYSEVGAVSDTHGDGYIMKYHKIDASGLDTNTYYPVTMPIGANINVRIEIRNSLDSNVPSWSTHPSGFSTRKIWEVNGYGWGTNHVNRRILVSDYSFSSSDPVRGIQQMTNSSTEVVYVRGGGVYHFYLSHGITPILRTSTFVGTAEPYYQAVSPTTTEPSIITRNIAYTTDIPTDYASSNHTHTKSQITDFPSSMPASDVYSWAKASSKPTYTYSEVGAAAASHTHSYLPLSGGTLTGLLTTTSGNTHNGIKIGSNYINAINGDLIFQNNGAIRFGGDSWDYNVWAGLKYVHSSKSIYLGLADGTQFTANTGQSGGKVYFPGISGLYAAAYYQSSDERLKTFYDPIKPDLEKLKTLRKNYFKFNDKDKLEIGVSAQEIQSIYPEIVSTDDNGYLSVAYDKLSVIALAAIDELDDNIKELRRENNDLKDQLEAIKNILKEKGIL